MHNIYILLMHWQARKLNAKTFINWRSGILNNWSILCNFLRLLKQVQVEKMTKQQSPPWCEVIIHFPVQLFRHLPFGQALLTWNSFRNEALLNIPIKTYCNASYVILSTLFLNRSDCTYILNKHAILNAHHDSWRCSNSAANNDSTK